MKSGRSFWKKVRVLLLILLIIGIAIQFIRPRLDNPPVTADLKAPVEVKAILQRACYDCHSNETHLAWFDQPAPAYWLVVNHVKQGRKVLNFSSFDSLPRAVQAGKLYESLNQIEYGVMPVKQYTTFHHGGRVTPEEVEVLKQYLLTLAPKAVPDTAKQRASLEQYEKWMMAASSAASADVKDEYNGISYKDLAGFRDWKAMSTTERFDNGTMRLILGNDVAQKAVKEGHTNPWPNGTAFAKVAWDQRPDSSGMIWTGAFKQVEFMIRDNSKYASTAGWGWARWVGGLGLKPYGKDASFTTECINCHKPMTFNDQVFTFPLGDSLDKAEVSPGYVITTFVDTRSGTMSTLYGNEIAVRSARAGKTYPAGSELSLVTWSQRDDAHWYGGRIPKALHSVATVKYNANGVPVGLNNQIDYIAGLKASLLP
ncbi:MAG TPA: cytochrome P460 family protein [Puia sp.]